MASGQQHLNAWKRTWWFTVAFTGTVLVLGSPKMAVGAMVGYLTHPFAGPDLDLRGITVSETLFAKVPLIGPLWIALWYHYAQLIPHRSFWSHGPIIGTLGRVAWIALWWLLVSMVTNMPAPQYGDWILGFVFIWAFYDALHWIMDLGKNRR